MEPSTNEVLNEDIKSSAEPKKEKPSVKEMGNKLADGIKNLFSEKNRKEICLILLALIVAIGCIAVLSSGSSPKAVAERYIEAGLLQDNAVVSKLTAYDFKEYTKVFSPKGFPPAVPKFAKEDRPDDEEFFENCSDVFDEDINSWGDLFAVQKKLQKEAWEDEFGKFKITVEVTREKDISVKKAKSELADWLEMLEDLFAFDTDTIEECKLLTAKVKIVGEDSIDRETCQIYLCKINGAWKVLYLE